VRRVLFILLLVCSALWAKPAVFISSVELDGVHQDFADRLVLQTRNRLEKDGEVWVTTDSNVSVYTLKIKLLRQDDGVVVAYTLMDSDDKEVLWTYKHMAFTPDDFESIVDMVSRKFNKWNGFYMGFGLGMEGLLTPHFSSAPAATLLVQYRHNSGVLTWDFNYGYDYGGTDDFTVGSYLSLTYVFDGKTVYPYVGPGIGYTFLSFCYDLGDRQEYGEENGGLTYFLRTGAFYRPKTISTFFALDVRFLYDDFKLENDIDKSMHSVYGWSVAAQVWW